MSIYFDFDVGPADKRFRRAVDADKYCVDLFWNKDQTECLFGEVDLGSMIELCTLSICQIDKDKNVTGIMILDDRPNIPAVDPADWEVWIRNMYQKYYLSRNTLFIHFMCCDESVLNTFFEEAVITVFKNDIYLNQLILMVNNACPTEHFMKYPAFSRFFIKRHRSIRHESAYHIYLISREAFIAKLKIRRAVEEDNDDVVQILHKKSKRLRQLYGDFYLGELVSNPGSRVIIVAEVQDHAGGVMCVNSEINYQMLQDKYNLSTMHGLRKATPFEIEARQRGNILLNMFAESIMTGQCTPFLRLQKPKREKEKDLAVSVRSSKVGRISYRPKFSNKRCDDVEDVSEDEISITEPQLPQKVVQILDVEPDELEFEIINIDQKLISSTHLHREKQLVSKRLHPKPKFSIQSTFVESRFYRRSTTYVYDCHPAAYLGSPNAFTIELYALDENIDDTDGVNLLEGAFEIMHRYDYCIIRQPFSEPTFPLLQNFCYIPPKPNEKDYSLYVVHRNSFLSKLRVREAEVMDIPQITKFLCKLDVKKTVWKLENNLLTKPDHAVYLLISGCAVVGVAIVDKKVEIIDFLRVKYNMSVYHRHRYHYKGMDYQSGFCTLVTALVYPVFEPHYRFFIRDILRLADRNCMIWLTNYRNKWESIKMNCLACAMVPLLPTKTDTDVGNIFIKKPQIKNFPSSAYSVWFMSRKLTSLPRHNVDTRILVIGASRAAISFLNTLLFSPSSTYLTFTDVTLLSTYGLPHLYQGKSYLTSMADMMFPCYRVMTDKHMRRIPYSYYANIVKGTMVEIDREKKYVATSKGERYRYDMLFLLFGKQYQHPHYLKDVLEHEKKVRKGQVPYVRLDNPKSQDRYEKERSQWRIHYPPENVFIVNSMADAHTALSYVKELKRVKTQYNIIVYGASIHAYLCLSTLIELRVPSKRIIFVEPFPPLNQNKTRVTVFCNTYVDQAVNDEIQKLNIKVYRKFYFQSWEEEYNRVTNVNFNSYFQQLKLKCDVLFYYGKRGVDTSAYIGLRTLRKALHKSGICYDGGVLIDHNFQTRDPSVYSAGTVTRYGQSVYTNSPHQKYYHSPHLGEKLGIQIRNMLDPKQSSTTPSDPENTSNEDSETSFVTRFSERAFEVLEKSEIEFSEPIVLHCRLPGGLYFLNVRPPGLKTPHPYVQSLHYNGIVMETFEGGYFKLHLNTDFIVDGITCLTKQTYALENFVNLYGLPAVVLNNMHIRYATKKIDDFFSFFTAPWAYWLYHPNKNDLLALVKELTPEGSPKGATIREMLLQLAKKLNVTEFNEETKLNLRSALNMAPYIKEISGFVIEWLTDYHSVLPMYVQLWQARSFDFDKNKNPLFKKKKRHFLRVQKNKYSF